MHVVITCLLSTRHKLNNISIASSLGVFCSPDMQMFAICRLILSLYLYGKTDSFIIRIYACTLHVCSPLDTS